MYMYTDIIKFCIVRETLYAKTVQRYFTYTAKKNDIWFVVTYLSIQFSGLCEIFFLFTLRS